MSPVSTLSVGAFWRDGMLNTLHICHFTVYTKSVMKYAYNKFLIDNSVTLTSTIILIDSKYDKTICSSTYCIVTYITEQYVKPTYLNV